MPVRRTMRLQALFALLLLLVLWPATTPPAQAATVVDIDWGTLPPSGTAQSLNSISCTSVDHCVAVGDNGVVVVWNGTAWSSQTSGTTAGFTNVSCSAVNHCVAVGGGGLIRAWNGTTWAAQTSGTGNDVFDVRCTSTSHCVTMGAGGVIRLWNGATWNGQTSATTDHLFGLHCFSANDCIAVGNAGRIVRWNGASWAVVTSPTGQLLYDIACTSTSHCVAVGLNGALIVWNGASWASQTSGTSVFLRGVSCVSASICLVVGDGGAIRISTGPTWSVLPSGTTNVLQKVVCTGTMRCIAVGAGGTVLGSIAVSYVDTALNVLIDATAVSCLTGVSITEVIGNHPNASVPLQTGKYWNITTTPASCPTAYQANLTLPLAGADANDKLCRYTGTGIIWDCARTSNTANGITRTGISQFSPWAVGNNAGPTLIDLASFMATTNTGGVRLQWATATEYDVAGYHLYRGATPERGAATRLTDTLVPAPGDGVIGGNYEWLDTTASAEMPAYYWLDVIALNGEAEAVYGPVQPPPATGAATNQLYLPLVVR